MNLFNKVFDKLESNVVHNEPNLWLMLFLNPLRKIQEVSFWIELEDFHFNANDFLV